MNIFNPDTLKVTSGNFINGRLIQGSGEAIEIIRPSDGQVYHAMNSSTADDVNTAVENSWSAFHKSGWSSMPPRDRMKIMRHWADLIDADVENLAPLEGIGSTRPILDAKAWDVPFTAEGIRFFSEFADKFGGEIAASEAGKLGLTIAEPYGIVGAIAPWNFPLVMASWKVAAAMAAGNTVVLKPSEMTPFSVIRLAELAIKAGVPAGVFNVIQGYGHIAGDALCRHPKISKVTFTGSTKTGSAIMSACAETGPKPVTLELGGKSPQIVFDDPLSIDETAGIVAKAITGNAGQVCNAGSRLLVDEKIAEEFISLVKMKFSDLNAGPTWSDKTSLSPIISAHQCEMIDGAVKNAVSNGAEALCGAEQVSFDHKGAFYAPTILTKVENNSEAVKKELFGPVMTVQTFSDEDEAITMANDSEYGLAAGVHTADLSRAMRAIHKLESGNVWVNRYGRSNDFILPTGGYKKSGIGKDLGKQAFEANLRIKTALIEFPI